MTPREALQPARRADGSRGGVGMPAHVRADDLSALVWATAFDTGEAKVDCEQHERLVDINELSRCQAEGRKWSQIVGISKLPRDKCFAHFATNGPSSKARNTASSPPTGDSIAISSNSSTMFSPASAASRGPRAPRSKQCFFFARCYPSFLPLQACLQTAPTARAEQRFAAEIARDSLTGGTLSFELLRRRRAAFALRVVWASIRSGRNRDRRSG